MQLRNKTILVTGGTSGIGYQLVKSLCTTNNVLVIARPGQRLAALQQGFASIEVFPADLSDPAGYRGLVRQILTKHSQIDLLINNAAVQNTPTFLSTEFDFAALESEVHLNFTSVCALSYLLLPALMATKGEAAILNINSGLGLAPKAQSAVYCATKGAMHIFSQALDYQLVDTQVTVMQAFLPLVDTPMTEGRGRGKLSSAAAAAAILAGLEQGRKNTYVGKARWLRWLLLFVPPLARRMMRGM